MRNAKTFKNTEIKNKNTHNFKIRVISVYFPSPAVYAIIIQRDEYDYDSLHRSRSMPSAQQTDNRKVEQFQIKFNI